MWGLLCCEVCIVLTMCLLYLCVLRYRRSAPLFSYLESALRTGCVPESARQHVPDITDTFSSVTGSVDREGGAEHFAMGMLGASRGETVQQRRYEVYSRSGQIGKADSGYDNSGLGQSMCYCITSVCIRGRSCLQQTSRDWPKSLTSADASMLW